MFRADSWKKLFLIVLLEYCKTLSARFHTVIEFSGVFVSQLIILIQLTILQPSPRSTLSASRKGLTRRIIPSFGCLKQIV